MVAGPRKSCLLHKTLLSNIKDIPFASVLAKPYNREFFMKTKDGRLFMIFNKILLYIAQKSSSFERILCRRPNMLRKLGRENFEKNESF